MDGVKTIKLATSSHEFKNHENLVVRCSKALDVYFVTTVILDQDFAAGNVTPVRIRTDKSSPSRQLWDRSTDSEGAFSPKPKALFQSLRGAKELIIEYTPYEGVATVASFDVDGLATELHKYFECRQLGF